MSPLVQPVNAGGFVAALSLLAPAYASAQDTVRIVPGFEDESLGSAVVAVGDLDGDGFGDLAIGALGSGSAPTGRVRVISGDDTSTIFEAFGEEDDGFGLALSAIGDVDGDGITDLIAGAPTRVIDDVEVGVAVVISGADGSALMELQGVEDGGQFGAAVAGLGDVNGDGIGDFVVGAPSVRVSGAQAGRATVISGANGEAIHTFTGVPSPASRLGRGVARLDDLDGDGVTDVLVSAPGQGRVYAYSGATGEELLMVSGGVNDEGFGFALSSAGDIDGDGVTDVIVGAPLSDANGNNSGRVLVFSGLSGDQLYLWEGQANERYGSAVAGGDLDGDSFGDILIGAPDFGTVEAERGVIEIYSGATGFRLTRTQGEPGERLGASVARVGDVNGDFFPDFAAGAPNSMMSGSEAGRVVVLTLQPRDPFEPYCQALPNSRGLEASLEGLGLASVSDNNFGILARDVIPDGPGLYFYGGERTVRLFGDGLRCVGGRTFRASPLLFADPAGNVGWQIDLEAPPASAGPGQILPGSTWHFQYWYRDANSSQTGSNTTDGLTVYFGV